jgi:dihydroorotase
MAQLLLRGGRVVDPSVGLDGVMDVLVKGHRIEAVGKRIEAPSGVTVIECAEKVVVPGLVDLPVHLREPGREDEETIATGTRAAAHGGFTAVAAMPNTLPVTDEGAAVRFIVERAAEHGVVRVLPVGACTVGLRGESLAEIGDMVAEGAVAVTDDGRGVQDAGMMRRVMDYTRAFGIPVMSHCEDETLVAGGVVNEGVVSTRLGLAGWPTAAEEIQACRDIRLAELTGCRLHLQHVSTRGTVELVRQAKERGVPVTAEATPHHLFLDEDALDSAYDTSLKMNPPLRSAGDREALVEGLLDGTVDCVATDHAPHAPHEKALEFEVAPFGTTGLETALPLVLTHLVGPGHMTWSTMVDRMSHAARRILGLDAVSIVDGGTADLTIIDPECKVEVTETFFLSGSTNSAFLAATLLGKATEVVVAGRLVLRNGKVVA